MKMKKGNHVIECVPFHKHVWERYGFKEIEEVEEISYKDMKRIAKENGINSYGMKKEELEEVIKKYI